ncbi:Ku protein [Kitasatospora sp. NPDC085895]|uniref:non-homologous end joining protein Ku n=1 Tax=Kitasatospora sp. NPDC085895 TaxID=3155057 RepID=UPI00344DBC94
MIDPTPSKCLRHRDTGGYGKAVMTGPVWTGALTIGLITLPIALYKVVETHDISFHRIERGTSDRVRVQWVNERTGAEVSFQDLERGFDAGGGEYLTIEPSEFEEVPNGRSKNIEVLEFVNLSEIPPAHFRTPYYLGPRGKEHAKTYQLLASAMEHSRRAGVAPFSIRDRTHLGAVYSEGGVLTLHTLYFADEIRDPHREVDHLPTGGREFGDAELRMAERLIDLLTTTWNPQKYTDARHEQIRRIVEEKLATREMDALRQSLASFGEDAEDGHGEDHPQPDEGGPTPRGETDRNFPRKPGRQQEKARKEISALPRNELYRRARELDIPHRSTMNRKQLIAALLRAANS